jgi:WXG100 family type VII secretion target
MAVVVHSELVSFADAMRDISQSIQAVLSNYDQHSTELHHSGGLQGAAGTGNLTTSAQILEAQTRIQHRFNALNDLVTQAAHGYTSTDENNAQQIMQVASHLRYH